MSKHVIISVQRERVISRKGMREDDLQLLLDGHPELNFRKTFSREKKRNRSVRFKDVKNQGRKPRTWKDQPEVFFGA